jgi:hypothetical protein
VFPWRATPFNENELPGLIVRDLDEPQVLSSTSLTTGHPSASHSGRVVLKGDAPINDLWAAYADIEAAIGEGRESVWADITKRDATKDFTIVGRARIGEDRRWAFRVLHRLPDVSVQISSLVENKFTRGRKNNE